MKKQAEEELKFYKLELLNREENFNKKFGRTGALKTNSRVAGMGGGGVSAPSGLPPLPKGGLGGPAGSVRVGGKGRTSRGKKVTSSSKERKTLRAGGSSARGESLDRLQRR